MPAGNDNGLGTRPEASGEQYPVCQEASNCQEGIGIQVRACYL